MSEVPLYTQRSHSHAIGPAPGSGGFGVGVKSNSHGARPVHLIITMIKWIRTSRLSIKNSLSGVKGLGFHSEVACPFQTTQNEVITGLAPGPTLCL